MEIKILHQNVRGEKPVAKEDMQKFLKFCKAENIDVILLSEYSYKDYSDEKKSYLVDKELEKMNYKIIWPKACNGEPYSGNTAMCMMAIRNDKGLKFDSKERDDQVEKTARYIEGTLTKDGKSIEMFFVYVPQCYVPYKEKFTRKEVLDIANRYEWKAEMLFAAHCFLNENKNKPVFIGGDFNTSKNEADRTSMTRIFQYLCNEMNDKDTHEPTWKEKRLDYALISDALRDSCKRCKTERLRDNGAFDHEGLLTTIEF